MTSLMATQDDFKVVSLYMCFLVNKKTHIFLGNWKTYRDNILKLGVHVYNGILNKILQIVMDYAIDYVIRSQNTLTLERQ